MATPTLAVPRSPKHPQLEHQAQIIDEPVNSVAKIVWPKPQEPEGCSIPNEVRSDEERNKANAAMLNELWNLAKALPREAFQFDPLKIALSGFPDVNTYRVYYEGDGNEDN